MELEVDQQQIFYSVGAFLAVAASIYSLGSQIALSVLTKSIILFLSFTGFLIVAQIVEGKEIRLITSGLSGVSAVLFVTYTVFRFDMKPPTVLLGLAVSAAAFMIAGYNLDRIREYDWPLNAQQAGAGIVLLALAFVVVDAATGDLAKSYEWRSSVEIEPNQEVELGNVTFTNSFYLPRRIDGKGYTGCIYTPERRQIYINREYDDALLWKGGRTLEITARVSQRPDSNETVNGTYPVEVVEGEECPEDVSERKIMVVKSVE